MKNEFKVISDLIEDNKKALDVGCADGTLMQYLKENKNINVRGLEISKEKVQECIVLSLFLHYLLLQLILLQYILVLFP